MMVLEGCRNKSIGIYPSVLNFEHHFTIVHLQKMSLGYPNILSIFIISMYCFVNFLSNVSPPPILLYYELSILHIL